MPVNMPQYKRQVQFQRTGMNNEEAQGFKTLANQLEQFSNQQQDAMDRAAALQGETAGQTAAAGKTSGVVMQDDSTIYSRSFNKGARMAYAAAIQTDIRENVSRIQRENSHDVMAYDTALGGYKKGLMSKMDSALIPHATQELYALGSQGRSNVEGNVFQKNKEASFAAITKNVLDTDKLAIAEVKAGNVEGYAKYQTQLFGMYDEAVENNLMDANAVEKLKDAFEERAYSAGIIGSFERTLQTQGIEQAKKGLELFEKETHDTLTETSQENIEAKMKSLISAEQTKINQIKTKKSAELKLKTKAAKDALDGFNAVIDQGHLPDVKALEFALQTAAGTEHEADMKGIQAYTNMYVPFIAMSAEAQANELAQAKNKKNMSEQEAQVWKRLEEVHTRTITDAKDNGLELFYKQGLTQGAPLPELNFSLLDTAKIVNGNVIAKTEEEIAQDKLLLAAQIANNIKFSEKAGVHYNMYVPPITKQQSESILYDIQQGDADNAQFKLRAIVEQFGDYAPDVMEAIFADDSSVYLAVGGLLVEGDSISVRASRNITLGLGKLEQYPNIVPENFEDEANAIIGNTYMAIDSSDTDHHQMIVSAAKALYAQKMAINGNFGTKDDEVDIDVLQSVFTDIVGGYVDIEINSSSKEDAFYDFFDNDYRIEAPKRGMDADQTEEWLESITAEDIDKLGGVKGMTSTEAAELIKGGYTVLVSTGSGKYYINNGLTGNSFQSAISTYVGEEPFELDFFATFKPPSIVRGGQMNRSKNKRIKTTTKTTTTAQDTEEAVEIINSINDGISDVNTSTDAAVVKLTDMANDDAVLEKNTDKRNKRLNQRKNQKKKTKKLTIGKNDEKSFVGLEHFENEDEAIKYLRSKGKTEKGGVWYIKTKDGRIIK